MARVFRESRCGQHRPLRWRLIGSWPRFRSGLRRVDVLKMALVAFIQRPVSSIAIHAGNSIWRWRELSWMELRTWGWCSGELRPSRLTHSHSIQERWPIAKYRHPPPINRPPSRTKGGRATDAVSLHHFCPNARTRRCLGVGVNLHLIWSPVGGRDFMNAVTGFGRGCSDTISARYSPMMPKRCCYRRCVLLRDSDGLLHMSCLPNGTRQCQIRLFVSLYKSLQRIEAFLLRHLANIVDDP